MNCKSLKNIKFCIFVVNILIMKAILFFLILSISSIAQEDAWVYFNSKPNANSQLANPLTILSQRSLDRRAAQSIPLDFKDATIHQPYIVQIQNATGISVLGKSKWLNALHIRGTQVNIQALISLPFVEKVVYANHSLNPTGKIALNQSKTKNNISLNKLASEATTFNYGNSITQIQMLNAHILHQQNYTGTGKIIAVMDSGFPGVDTAAPFARMRNNNLILGGYNFVENTNNPYRLNSHGTQTLSNMGGFADGQLVGTAPDAKYYLFVTEDVASENPIEETNWVEAAEMADSLGVDVINTSLGYYEYDNPNYSYNYALGHINGNKAFISKGASIAFTRGMICVTSAGNAGNSTTDPHIATPADVENTLTVGAVNNLEVKAGFSSIGPTSNDKQKPDVMAMGVSATVALPNGTIGLSNGTSFSSPIIAGAVTSFWSAFPNKTNAEIIQFVKASADRYSNPNNQYGFGVPDFQAALISALSTEKFDNKNTFKIFPNPVKEEVTLTLPDAFLNENIIFYNALGQKVKSVKLQNIIQTISLNELQSGLYSYEINGAQAKQNGRIIKN